MSRSAVLSAPFFGRSDAAPLADRRSACWRPGLAAVQDAPCHSEVFAPGGEASGAAAALALALDNWRHTPHTEAVQAQEDLRSVLWVQTKEAIRLGGRPFRAGLPEPLRARVIHVRAESCADALFALEEGVRCREIAFVVGEFAGNPRALDFTVSRRLTLTAERHGVPLYLVRLDAQHDLSSARMRWDVISAPSQSSKWNAQAPGEPVWHAELFRARGHPPGTWLLSERAARLSACKPMLADNDTQGEIKNAHWAAGLATGMGRAAPRSAVW
ncbi:hypothetical protein ACRAQ7_13635 [Erythrobacter sp. W53]|uniref:hypothetical protein n=1 Tax=Erythrobacteraceae TaxID=335929 RepID=UPI0036D20DBF